MSIKKSKIISDIELRLTKGKPSDDMAIYRNQIAYWMDTERDNLLSEVLSFTIKNGDDIDPIYIEQDLCLSPLKTEDNCADCKNKYRFYIDLSKSVLHLPGDRGIVRIVDNKGKIIPVFNQLEMDDIRFLPYAKPTKYRQAAYREGDRRIFIEVLEESSLKYFEYDVYYVPRAAGQSIKDDEDYPIADEDIPELVERVVRIGLLQMNAGEADLENDGTDPTHYAGE